MTQLRDLAALPPFALLSAPDVQKVLGVSRGSLFRWTRDGVFPQADVRLPGGKPRWRKDTVEAWTRQQETPDGP